MVCRSLEGQTVQCNPRIKGDDGSVPDKDSNRSHTASQDNYDVSLT